MPVKPIKVLIIDDSAAVRAAMSSVIDTASDIEVMATAADPIKAAAILRKQVPDVITLDVEMPRMDGITFLRRLMSQHPIPVLMCSSLVEPNSETLGEAMRAGAVDVICKPRLGIKGFLEDGAVEICDAIRAVSQAKVVRVPEVEVQQRHSPDDVLSAPTKRAMAKTTDRIVAIGASTGGTEALRFVLESMPANAPPIVIVQHMPETFTSAFARRLDGLCAITVKEAVNGDRLLRGHALIAPGGRHLVVQRRGAQYEVEIRDGPLVSRHRPSVDVLFRSTARAAGVNAVGIIMTGMGDDGAIGLGEMRAAGATTLGQDEATSVVFGMPRVAHERGSVERLLPLQKIPAALLRAADI